MSVVIGKPAFWAPGFFVMSDEVDKPLLFKFELRFKRLPTSRHKQLQALIDSNVQLLKDAKPPAITDAQLLDEVLVDWRGFKDAEGKPVIYTPAMRVQVAEDYYGMEAAMTRCWLEYYFPAQVQKEAEKNSEALSVTT